MSAQTQPVKLTLDDVKQMIANSRKGATSTDPQEIYNRILQRVAAKTENENRPPVPLSTSVTKEQQKTAKEISYDTDNLVVRFVRQTPTVSTTVDSAGRKKHSLANGAPRACLVAFKNKERLYIGWSKYNAALVNEGGIIRPLEDKPFTKEHARYTAILRGLVDSVVVQGKDIRSGASNKVVPGCIVRELKTFVARTRKYFKIQDIANLVGNM